MRFENIHFLCYQSYYLLLKHILHNKAKYQNSSLYQHLSNFQNNRIIYLNNENYREKKQKTMKIPHGKVDIFMTKKNHQRKKLIFLR